MVDAAHLFVVIALLEALDCHQLSADLVAALEHDAVSALSNAAQVLIGRHVALQYTTSDVP